MELNLKIFLISCSFLSLSTWAFGSDFARTGNTYELTVSHPHGEHHVMDVIRAGETVSVTTTEASPGTPVKPTSSNLQDCMRIGSCCYQYTWPGTKFDDGNTNFTCDKYVKTSGSKEPCKLPIVFTNQNKKRGARPNITELEKFANANNYEIYCVRTSSCIKYSYFLADSEGNNVLWNETRFCGVVRSVNKKTTIQKGCYKQKIGVYIKELCVSSVLKRADGIDYLNLLLSNFGNIQWLFGSLRELTLLLGSDLQGFSEL
ncbi:unnamed protein product [Allacma fusca]|uniref:Uncharacterized protein n=1 Tax=Allacma fusca TaxID=39272 RepID=A0A8J2Q2P7_9HEXA|nr:unnamed protein product [Allacma fusca]